MSVPILVRPSGGDDTARIQSYLTSAVDGDTVMLQGPFSLSSETTLSRSGVSVIGIGATVTQTGTNKRSLILDQVERCRVQGIRFIGKGTETPWAAGATAGNEVAGVRLVGCSNCEVSQNDFSNHAGCSVAIDSTADNVRIVNNTITGMGSGVISVNDNGSDAAIRGGAASLAKTRLLIRGNSIKDHCFGLLIPGVFDAIIDANFISTSGQHGMYLTACNDLAITSNILQNCAQDGVKVQLQTEEDLYGAINIVGNTVSNCGYTSGKAGINVLAVGAAVLGSHYEWCVNIASNNVYKASYGILVRGARNCAVSGNRVSDTALHSYYAQYAEVSFRGNYAANSERAPVFIQYPTNTVVVDGMTILDGPRNVGEHVADYTGRAVIFVDDEASPNNGHVLLNNIFAKFENYSAKAGTGALYAFIYATANTQLYLGPCVNLTGATNTLAGSETAPATPA